MFLSQHFTAPLFFGVRGRCSKSIPWILQNSCGGLDKIFPALSCLIFVIRHSRTYSPISLSSLFSARRLNILGLSNKKFRFGSKIIHYGNSVLIIL